MKISCNGLELSSAISIVSKAIPSASKNSRDILQYIKLSAFNNVLTITATDLELTLEKKIDAEIKEEGAILVTGKVFSDVVKGLSYMDEVNISTKEDDNIILEYLDNATVLKSYNVDEFPQTTIDNTEYSFKIKQSVLKDLINKTLFATSKIDNRPILKGCYFVIDKYSIRVVALDGVKLALANATLEEEHPNFSFIVPQKSLNELKNILSDNDEEITLSIGNKKLVTNINTYFIMTRLIEGTFIKYENIIPSNYETKIIINKNDISSSLTRAEIISRDLNNNTVELTVKDNKLNIYAISERGKVNENITIDNNADREIKIAVNIKYLIEIFSVLKEEKILIEIKNSTNPLIIKDVDDVKFIYLVLPIKIQ